MADQKISALTAAGSVVAANEFAINEAGASKKATAQQIADFVLSGRPERHMIRADVTRTLPNNTNLNAIFNSPTNGRVTLTTGVYLFELMLIVTAMSATSGNALINIRGAGTATIGSWLWQMAGLDNTTPSTIADDDAAYLTTEASAASAVVAGTGTALRAYARGTFEVTTGGTLIPSIDLVTAAAGIVSVGSFFLVERMMDVNAASVGDWD